MKNIECIIIYCKVEDKTVPEIFYESDEAKKFLDSAEQVDKIDSVMERADAILGEVEVFQGE